jgi:hypothetical protein
MRLQGRKLRLSKGKKRVPPEWFRVATHFSIPSNLSENLQLQQVGIQLSLQRSLQNKSRVGAGHGGSMEAGELAGHLGEILSHKAFGVVTVR